MKVTLYLEPEDLFTIADISDLLDREIRRFEERNNRGKVSKEELFANSTRIGVLDSEKNLLDMIYWVTINEMRSHKGNNIIIPRNEPPHVG